MIVPRRHQGLTFFFAALFWFAIAGGQHPGASSSSSSLWVAASEGDAEIVCDIALDINTWEDKTIPTKEIPVPSTNVLKYGIVAVLDERFDVTTGPDTWMTQDKFHSYELKAASTDGGDGETAALAALASGDAPSSSILPDWLSSSTTTTSPRRNLRSMPKECARDHKCRYRWMRKMNSRILLRGSPHRRIECRFCTRDDDFVLEEDVFGGTPGPDGFFEVTLDQIDGGGGEEALSSETSRHAKLEQSVCAELEHFQDAYSGFEVAENCKITFRCRTAVEEDHLLGGSTDPHRELAVVDHRGSGGTGPDNLLYSVRWADEVEEQANTGVAAEDESP